MGIHWYTPWSLLMIQLVFLLLYLPPFSATSPLSSSPAVSFNPLTGDICMTPTNLEVTVMAVLVQEYRNDVLIGSVERDIQVTVTTCNNILPTLGGINGTNSFQLLFVQEDKHVLQFIPVTVITLKILSSVGIIPFPEEFHYHSRTSRARHFAGHQHKPTSVRIHIVLPRL